MSQPISCRLVSLNDVALIFRHKAKLHGALENLKAWVFFSRGKACGVMLMRGEAWTCICMFLIVLCYQLISLEIS